MEAFQARLLLMWIQRSANEGDCRAVRDLACAGMTLLNGSDAEAHEAWKEIEAAHLPARTQGNATLPCGSAGDCKMKN